MSFFQSLCDRHELELGCGGMATTPRISSMYIDEEEEYFPNAELSAGEEIMTHRRAPSRTPLDRTIDKIGMGDILQIQSASMVLLTTATEQVPINGFYSLFVALVSSNPCIFFVHKIHFVRLAGRQRKRLSMKTYFNS